jgi:hypothetical protein
VLESKLWKSSCFTTLTYDQDHLPLIGGVPTLQKADMQGFLKRLRQRLPQKIRYFGCGEYGDQSGRPHYHLVIFNIYEHQWDAISASWDKGFIVNAPLTVQRAVYTARYTTKKLIGQTTHKDGTDNEFATFSRHPGLASGYVPVIGDTLLSLRDRQIPNGDPRSIECKVPAAIRVDGSVFPLDRYMTGKLIKYLNETDPIEHTWTIDMSVQLENLRNNKPELCAIYETLARKESENKAKRLNSKSAFTASI